NLIPLRHSFIDDCETPVSAFLKLREAGPAFLLESADQGQRVGRYSFIGFRPRAASRCALGDPRGPAAGAAAAVARHRRPPPPARALSRSPGPRARTPSPYMYFPGFGDFQVAGASPEPLLTVSGRSVSTRPIAGTRPRGADAEEDVRIARELLEDEKERAEHVMLVDLGRNDLGRVCEYGTVEVEDFMAVETYSHVKCLGELGAEVSVVRNDRATLDELLARAPERVVVSPGPCTPNEAGISLEVMRRFPEAGVATLGVCLGHQSLAQAFGGNVV